MKLRDMMNPNMILVDENTPLHWLIETITHKNTSYILTTKRRTVRQLFTPRFLMEYFINNPDAQEAPLQSITSDIHPLTLDGNTSLDMLSDIEAGTHIIITENSTPTGVLFFTRTIKQLYFYSINQQFNMPFHGFQEVFENIEEEIVVSNGNGDICYVNPKAEMLIGLPMSEILGKNLREMESRKIFYPSAALEVLNTHEKVNMRTMLFNGEERLSTAIPIFNDHNEIEYTVCTSKNVGEILKLNQQLQSKSQKLEQQEQEILRMQKREFEQMDFYFNSPAMFRVMKAIKRAAPLDMTVLIQGETGVGKEIVAKSIHYLSSRNVQPFIKINCGLIPENLIEAELFGYEEGAFTGASKGGKKGKIEMAGGGTLFLDEIGDMPLPLQIKLLDFLQDATYVRVGGTKRHKANVRIVSATNRDLRKMVDEGTFRMDLFYRLNVFDLKIPPLRERLEDIPELTEHFLKKFSSRYQLKRHLAPDVIYQMYQYSWPGNVRELEHTLERAIVMSEDEEITSDTLKEVLNTQQEPSLNIICNGIPSYKKAKATLEKLLIEKAYSMYGTTYKAAEALEIDQSTAARLWKKYRNQ